MGLTPDWRNWTYHTASRAFDPRQRASDWRRSLLGIERSEGVDGHLDELPPSGNNTPSPMSAASDGRPIDNDVAVDDADVSALPMDEQCAEGTSIDRRAALGDEHIRDGLNLAQRCCGEPAPRRLYWVQGKAHTATRLIVQPWWLIDSDPGG